MSTLRVTVQVDLDGVPVAGFPLVRRLELDESQGFVFEKATGGGYTAVPTGELATVQALVLTSDQDVTIRLNGQSDAGVALVAGGVLAIVDATINAGATTNVTVTNASGSTANIRGVAAGT